MVFRTWFIGLYYTGLLSSTYQTTNNNMVLVNNIGQKPYKYLLSIILSSTYQTTKKPPTNHHLHDNEVNMLRII